MNARFGRGSNSIVGRFRQVEPVGFPVAQEGPGENDGDLGDGVRPRIRRHDFPLGRSRSGVVGGSMCKIRFAGCPCGFQAEIGLPERCTGNLPEMSQLGSRAFVYGTSMSVLSCPRKCLRHRCDQLL